MTSEVNGKPNGSIENLDPKDLRKRVVEFCHQPDIRGGMAILIDQEPGSEGEHRLVMDMNFHTPEDVSMAITYFLIAMEKGATRARDLVRQKIIGEMLQHWMRNNPKSSPRPEQPTPG